jgi:hypothetical protein
VHNDRPHPDRRHKDNVNQQTVYGSGVIQSTAAQFDDHIAAAKPLNPAECLDQHSRLPYCFVHRFT